jgi:hypothetical protein
MLDNKLGLTDEQREVIEHAVACLELSELSAERELAYELRVIADRVAQPHPKCHGCPINPTCPSTTCGVSQPEPEPRAEVTDDDKADAERWRHFYSGHYIICKVHADGTVKNLGGGYVAKYAIDAARAGEAS